MCVIMIIFNIKRMKEGAPVMTSHIVLPALLRHKQRKFRCDLQSVSVRIYRSGPILVIVIIFLLSCGGDDCDRR